MNSHFRKLCHIVIGVFLCCIVEAASLSLTNQDVHDSTLDEPQCEWGQFYWETTKACEKCVKYCQNGKDSVICQQKCRDFMDEMDQKSKVEEKQVEVSNPEEVTRPGQKQEKTQDYLATILGAITLAVLLIAVVVACIKLRTRRKQVSDDIETGIPLMTMPQHRSPNHGTPNSPAQNDPLNQTVHLNATQQPTCQETGPNPDPTLQNEPHPMALNCGLSTTHANAIQQPTCQETGKRPKTFGPVSEGAFDLVLSIENAETN